MWRLITLSQALYLSLYSYTGSRFARWALCAPPRRAFTAPSATRAAAGGVGASQESLRGATLAGGAQSRVEGRCKTAPGQRSLVSRNRLQTVTNSKPARGAPPHARPAAQEPPAARGAAHLLIAKSSDGTVTRTGVRPLDSDERREEIARMLSGATVTDEARAQAVRLLETA